MKKCFGCGAKLQSLDKNKMGYIREDIIDKANYCERCFKITHYNENLVMPLGNINSVILDEVIKRADNNYVFFLIDFLNINNETINMFKSVTTSKTLVISKLDIIPKSIKISKIENAIRKIYGINDSIIFISSKNKVNIKSIYKVMEQNKKREAYILGYTNAGKSTLINNLCIDNNLTNNVITTSLIPNTTLDFITIKLNDELTLIDSPGFVMENNIYELNDFNLIKRIIPNSFLKPRTYQVKENNGIIIEDKFILCSDKVNSFTCYFSNQINISKVFKCNDYYEIKLDKNSDLVIKSLGFINIKEDCVLKINGLDNDLIEIRESIFSDR